MEMYKVKFVYYRPDGSYRVAAQCKFKYEEAAEECASADGYDVDYDADTQTFLVDCGDCED